MMKNSIKNVLGIMAVAFLCGEELANAQESEELRPNLEEFLETHAQYFKSTSIPQAITPDSLKFMEARAQWFKANLEKAKQGDAEAQYEVGDEYRDGFTVPRDIVESVKWYRKAAEQGHAEAQNSLDEIIKKFKRSRKPSKGDAVAQYERGKMHRNGNLVPWDDVEAAKWYRKSAEQGNAKAQAHLGGMYYYGEGVPQDYVEAVKWCWKAAEQGHAKAQSFFGKLYPDPEDVEAMKWLRKEAKSGKNTYAHYAQIKLDKIQRFKVTLKEAEQGNAEAQAKLGWMYHKAEGVPLDYVESVKWFRKAAEQGHDLGQFNLCKSYLEGTGIPKNYVEAYAWGLLAKANANNDGWTIGVIDGYISKHVEKRLTAEQIEKGQARAAELHQLYGKKPQAVR